MGRMKELQTAWDEAAAGGHVDTEKVRQYVEVWSATDLEGLPPRVLLVLVRLLGEVERLREALRELERYTVKDAKLEGGEADFVWAGDVDALLEDS